METVAYVYKWTHIPTLRWYVGCRYATGCHPDDGYICSSKIVKPLIKANPEEWRREIIAVGSKVDMLELEHEILTLFDAAKDSRSFNKNNGGGKFFGQQGPLSDIHYKNVCKAAKKRSADPIWYAANSKRLEDPEYLKKLKTSLQNSQNVKQAAKKRGADPEFRKSVSEGVLRYTSSPDYVNPRGMLGKTHSQEWKDNQSNTQHGKVKPLEGNKKISEGRKGRKPKQESIEKMRKALTGRESGRSRKVKTPAGIFDKLKDAAAYYEVAPGSIKNFINGVNVKEWFKPHLESKGIKFKGLKPLGFEWMGNIEKELGAKKIQTPDGIFNNAKEAGKFYNITPEAIRHRIKSQPDRYKKI